MPYHGGKGVREIAFVDCMSLRLLAASRIRAILAARKRALRRELVIEVGIMGPSSETSPNARHAESRACLARRRNHLTSKAKTVPEIHENASIARKARISTAINTQTNGCV